MAATQKEQALHKLMSITFGYMLPYVTRSAVRLGIPEILSESDSGLTLDQIVQKLSSKNVAMARKDLVFRILRFLVANDVLVSENVQGEMYYSNGEAGKLLILDDPQAFAHVLLYMTDKVFQAPWYELDRAVVEGGDCFSITYGKDMWEFAKENPEPSKLFNTAMASKSKTAVADILYNYKFEDIQTLVDVGGNHGYFLRNVVAAYPHIHGINFDLPHVIAAAPEIPGVEHLGGDMFESVPAADAIFFQTVLHDWNDEQCIKILKNCYDALPAHGKVLIVDHNLSDGRSLMAKLCVDLAMAVYTCGKERTEDEFEHLLTAAGFVRMNVTRISSQWSVVEAYKSCIYLKQEKPRNRIFSDSKKMFVEHW